MECCKLLDVKLRSWSKTPRSQQDPKLFFRLLRTSGSSCSFLCTWWTWIVTMNVFMSRAIYQPDKLWTTFSKNLTWYTILCKIGRHGFNAPCFLDLIWQVSATIAALKRARRMKYCNHNAFCVKICGSVRQTFPGGEFDLSCPSYPSRIPSSSVDP